MIEYKPTMKAKVDDHIKVFQSTRDR